MAFFGLTALGSQNEFAGASKFNTYINVFEDKDFEAVWRREVGDSNFCLMSKLPGMMEALYKGKVPENDHKLIFDEFNAVTDGTESDTISFYMYMSTLGGLREKCDQDLKDLEKAHGLKPTCEFNSTETLHEYMRMNRKFEKGLKSKQEVPLTAAQEYGWEPAKLTVPTTGRKQTNITRFAAELIKSGHAF